MSLNNNPYQEANNRRTQSRDYQRSCIFLNQIGGNVDNCICPTYLPTSYSDRPPLHAVWKRRDELEVQQRLAHNIDPYAPPSLRSLMAEKKLMEGEIAEAEAVRLQYRTKHITVLGKTDHLCTKESVEGILAEAKKLTEGRS